MSETVKKRELGKGIDIGTMFVKCAHREGKEIIFSSQRNAFFEVEYNDFTRSILDKSNVRYIVKDDKLYVVGDEALQFANMFNKETRRPLSKGVINPQEREALPIIELLIKNTIGDPIIENEIAYFSIPGEPIDAEFNVLFHSKTVEGFLRTLGYDAKPINEGHAIVLSECSNENFTAFGISCGGGMVNICLAFNSIPIFKFSIAKSGDWIDRQVSMAVNETASRITRVKETSLDLSKKDGSKIESALRIYYNHLIEYIIENIKYRLETTESLPEFDKPINMILAGGTSMPNGFDILFKEHISRAKFPILIGDVKRAQNPIRTVSKGALVAAVVDEKKKK